MGRDARRKPASHRGAATAAARCTAPAAAVLLCLAAGAPAGAVTLDWSDLTSAQQEKAYQQLESENAELKARIAQLESQLEQAGIPVESASGGTAGSGDGSGGGSGAASSDGSASGSSDAVSPDADAAPSSGEEIAEQAEEGSTLHETAAFLSDLAASFDARQETARTYTAEQVNAMGESDMWAFRFQCAETERSFFNKYHNAQFNDLNVLYLCSEYCLGLEKQFSAEDVWNSSQDSDEANRLYTAGYYNRAYALVELCEFYGLDLAEEYQNLRNAVAQMDALSGEETRNASVDPETVTLVQTLLNGAGFLCGAPDGIAGRQTASCIERFQLMYGYEPADGIIDDELISQLQSRQ